MLAETQMNEDSAPTASHLSVDPAAVEQAAEVLRHGGVVAFPTETSYGLGAVVDNVRALEYIYEIKKRPQDKPLLVLVDSVERMDGLVSNISHAARKLMDHFWPGPLTILFPAAPGLAWPLHCGTGKIGIRISSNPWAQALVEKLGRPVTATSANVSGMPPAADAQEVAEQLAHPGPDFILDGGPLSHGASSTIVDVTGDESGHTYGDMVRIIRPGVIGSEAIFKVVDTLH